MKKTKSLAKDGDTWRKAAQRLARAIIRFQNTDAQWSHTDSTIAFAYRVKKGNI
jgi:hypothetical protein